MILFPNAKINIGLQILSKRPDGYHNISTLLYPVPIFDILEVVKSKNNETTLSVTGIDNIGNFDDNLCIKAYKALAEEFDLPAVDIYLHKNIPVGAGLAGGSSNAAFTLKALNVLFNLNISNARLKEIAAKIGSDCAFFIDNKPALASSRGEILSESSLKLNQIIVIVKPDIFVSTPKAYSLTTPNSNVPNLADILADDISTWKENVVNDFEKPIFELFPQIGEIKQAMYGAGAVYASMSGSGSSVFGLFNETPDLQNIPENCKIFTGNL